METFINTDNAYKILMFEVKEAVKAVVTAGWSCTPQVKVVPLSKVCFGGRKNTLKKKNTSWLWLSITWKHFDWCRGVEFTSSPRTAGLCQPGFQTGFREG